MLTSVVAFRHALVKACWVVGGLCTAGLSQAQVPAKAAYPRPMTAQEAQDIAHVLKLTQPGKPYVLNHADPAQHRLALRNLALAGLTPRIAPRTYQALQNTLNAHRLAAAKNPTASPAAAMALAPQRLMAATPGAVQDLAEISNFGDDGKSGFTATGLSSVAGGTTQTTITTQLIDTQSGTVYGSATQTQYAQGTNFQVPVTSTVPTPTNLAAMATITTVVNGASTTVVLNTGKQQPASAATMTAPNFCVHVNPVDPKSACSIQGGQTQYQTTSTTLAPSGSSIHMCFARGSQASCDYYNATGRPPTSVFFPAAGTASFGSGYTVDASFATAGRYTVSINPASGGTCVFTTDAPLGTGWSLPSANTIQWNLAQVSPTNPSACLAVSGGQLVNFNFYVEVPLNGPGGTKTTGYVTLTSAYSPPQPPGFFGVPQLLLEDSCVAAGTLVRLADGSTVAVETLSADNEPMVKTATGDARKVLGTAKGVELHKMIRLKTNLGQELLITRTHPVLTVAGFVMARDLHVGERVRTEQGVASIVSMSAETYEGQVHSLRLGLFDEPKTERRTHSANGFFIGDSVTQHQLEHEERARLQSDKAHVIKRLPDAGWVAEYRNFLASRR